MDSSRASRSTLTALQDHVLRAFFARERGFFLTGGAALGGCATDDLDLFTTDDAAFERARHGLRDVADAVGATHEVRQDAPRFRAEERDLVDVMALEQAGHAVEDALPLALAKDGGCTPATLAWRLAETDIPDGVVLPAGVTPAALRAYAAALVVRLRRLALPPG